MQFTVLCYQRKSPFAITNVITDSSHNFVSNMMIYSHHKHIIKINETSRAFVIEQIENIWRATYKGHHYELTEAFFIIDEDGKQRRLGKLPKKFNVESDMFHEWLTAVDML